MFRNVGHVDMKKGEDMTLYQSYFNKDEFEPVNKMPNCPEKIQKIKAMAHAGNIQASYVYGDMLMIGAWDIKRIENDTARGQLLPQPEDINTDPYLILPRNQNYAIEYLKMAAYFPYEDACIEISKARAQLNYCRTKGNIGYYGYGKMDNFMNEEFYQDIDDNATIQDKLFNPFIPLPYERPILDNPKTKVFERAAHAMNITVSLLVMMYFLCGLFSILPLFVWKHNPVISNIVATQLFIIFAFTVPVIIVVIVIRTIHGSKRPFCSCPKIREAYDVVTSDLPEDLKQDDPFEETSSISKSIIPILLALFSTYAIVAIILGSLKFANIFDITKFFNVHSDDLFYSIVFFSVAFTIMTICFFKNIVYDGSDQICDTVLKELGVKSNTSKFDMLAEIFNHSN